MFFFAVVLCSPLSNIDNGNITYTTPLTEGGYIIETVAEFNCNTGYTVSQCSPEQTQCKRTGGWSEQTEICIHAGTKTIKYLLPVFQFVCPQG